MMAAEILIKRVYAPSDEVRSLIAELDSNLSGVYPPEQQHGLSVDAIFQPHIRFFIARLQGAPVGCAGVALFTGFAEIKRMYVREHSRGQGVADMLLETLETTALKAGLHLLRLETGKDLAAAIRFYGRCGFMPCSAFEPYSSMPPSSVAASLFFEKQLRISHAGACSNMQSS